VPGKRPCITRCKKWACKYRIPLNVLRSLLCNCNLILFSFSVACSGSEESEPEEEDADEETEAEDGSDEDPLEVLSDTTLKFLRSIGIKTAAQFLSMRTTDISPDFVTWRAEEGMAELKGTGPIASVSAWKTSVRNKAKQMGL